LMNIFWIPVRNSKQYSWNITRNVSEKSFSNVYSKWPGNLKFNWTDLANNNLNIWFFILVSQVTSIQFCFLKPMMRIILWSAFISFSSYNNKSVNNSYGLNFVYFLTSNHTLVVS
jgi:hypothetical protein